MPETESFAGRRVTVMGLGLFGGGTAVVRFFVERGALVTLTDLRTAAELSESLEELRDTPPHALRLGGHSEDDFTQADLVVINPAVRPDNHLLRRAAEAGVPTTSEIQLFWRHNRGQIIGVTGSNGKSTTAALLHAMLAADGRRTWLGGNIGRSLLPVVDVIETGDLVVLELSSFQLADLDALRVSPQVAVVTNFTPNHLDWHGTLAEYRQAKQTILRWQQPGDLAVLHTGDETAQWPTNPGVRRIHPALADTTGAEAPPGAESEHMLNDSDLGLHLSIPGAHNRVNAEMARSTAQALGVSRQAIIRAAQSFSGIPGRLEFLAEVQGRRFYNDTASTTPESSIWALTSCFGGQPIVLIAGGADKQLELENLASAIARTVKGVALLGATADSLARKIVRESSSEAVPQAGSGNPQIAVCGGLEEAFRMAVQWSSPGDVILLSPGCASLGMFRNFEERGRRFAELVADLAAAP